MKNKIVIVTQYYPPEIGGGSQRSVGFAEILNDLGQDVTVITPFPTYLMKKEEAGTKLKLYEKYEENGITIYNTFVYATDRGNFIKRILYYLSFTFSSILVGLIHLNRIDCLITVSPPLFTGITGIVLKKLKRTKFVFDIGDLWPESAVQLGFLNNKLAIKLAEKLERCIYRNSDAVNLVTKRTLDKIQKLHPYIKKFSYVPNFVNSELYRKSAKDKRIVSELNLKNKLVVGYAGNIGSAQGLNIMTDAARYTIKNKDIVYIILGDGVDREHLEKEVKAHRLDNVMILPPVSRSEVVKYISTFDLMVIPLVPNELFNITIPSKLYESMAAEIPVLLCVNGEARRIVEESKCGLFVQPGNAKMLSENILEIYYNRSLITQYGINGRNRVLTEFDRRKVVERFFNQVVKC